MKKLVQILVLGIFLAGCSALPNINLPQLMPTPTAPPTATKTPAPTRTPIPTQNMFATSTPTPLTFTPTVTMIGAELFTPTATSTDFPTPVQFTAKAPGAWGDDYFTPQDTGFINILYSYHVIYWNEGPCMPRNIKISAFVEDLINTDKVLLFMRLRDKKNTLHLSDWGAGALMLKADNGSFNYNIRTFNINDYYYFRDAWLEYQLVAYDKDMNEIGRTKIYDRNISLGRCQPTR